MASRNKKVAAGPADSEGRPQGRPELIVVLPAAAVMVQGGRVMPSDGPSRDLLASIADAPPDTLDTAQACIRPLFRSNPERLAVAIPPETDRVVSPLGQYFIVDGVVGGAEPLLEQLRAVDVVAGVYLKPTAQPPAPRAPRAALNEMAPRVEEPPTVTPDFKGRQGYLGPAPGGVDAQWAWTQQGGRGEGVNVIDVEGPWWLSHEDLLPRQIGVSAGTPPDDIGWPNHGTAATGVVGSAENGLGFTGIAPKASLSPTSIFGTGMSSPSAIKLATDALNAGDILLIELHCLGPLVGRMGQRGCSAVEWWPDDHDAIGYAVSRSIIVVEAGGNGSQDLDNPAHDTPQRGRVVCEA